MDRLDGSTLHDLWRCSLCTHSAISPSIRDWRSFCVLVLSWQAGLVSARFLLECSEIDCYWRGLVAFASRSAPACSFCQWSRHWEASRLLLWRWRSKTPRYVRFSPGAPLLFEPYVGEAHGSSSSYSMRRVGPTWATMAALSEPDKLALGNWIDKGVAVGQNAARYSAFQVEDCNLVEKLFAFWEPPRTFPRRFLGLPSLVPKFNNNCWSIANLWILWCPQSMEEIISTVTPSPDDVALALRPSIIQAARKRVGQLRKRLGAPLPVVDEPHEAVEPRDAGADEFYDFLARERWRRPGHSGRPEPFTAIHQGENLGNIWLGGLPIQDDIPPSWNARRSLSLSVPWRRQHRSVATSDIGTLFQMAVAVGYNGSDRQRSWEEVRMVVLSTLQSGESVLFHCRAGVHRGPMLAAAVALAWVTRISFDDALYITSSRFAPLSLTKFALGPVVIRFSDWARREANRDLPSFSLPRHWAWRASSRSSCLWHVVSADGDSGPMCKWRQSDAKNVFKGQTVSCNTTLEALGYDREICRVCAMLRPGSEWVLMHPQVRRWNLRQPLTIHVNAKSVRSASCSSWLSFALGARYFWCS